MKQFKLLAVILLVVLTGSMASASIVSLDYVRVEPSNVVDIDGIFDKNVYAGNYVVDIQGFGEFYGYCVDPSWAPSDYSEYDLRSIDEGSRYDAAAWILAQGYTGDSATAAQIAVWELVWDWSGGTNIYNLSSGNFIYLGLSYSTAATNIIDAALSNYGTFDASGYTLAVSPPSGDHYGVNYQDYIIPNVPIPSAILIFGSGLVALVGVRRKINKKA